MLNAARCGSHTRLLCPKRIRAPFAYVLRGVPVRIACEQGEVDAPSESEGQSKRRTIIIKRTSKATQTRAPRARTPSQDAESVLKAVRDTLEWYFKPQWPTDKEVVLRQIHISRGYSVPLDLIFKLRRLKRIMKANSKEDELEIIQKALSQSELLELSEDGMRIQKKDTADLTGVSMMVVVAVALLNDRGQILLSQRKVNQSFPGKWEFPGGKVNAYEVPETALIRELREELCIEVDREHLQPLSFGSHQHGGCHILMPLFLCTQWKGEVRGNEGQEVEWCSVSELRQREMPPGDLPLIDAVDRAIHDHAQSPLSIAA